jgi:hypothetical protein
VLTPVRYRLPDASWSLFITKTRRTRMILKNLRDLRGFVIPVRLLIQLGYSPVTNSVSLQALSLS